MDYGQAFFAYTASLKLADAFTVVGMWYLCWYLRFERALLPVTKGLPDFDRYSSAALPLAIVFTIVFHVVGAYRKDRIHFGFRAMKKVLQGTVLATLVFIAILYFLREFEYSRIYLGLFLALAFLGVSVERALMQSAWNLVEKNVIREIRLLLVGGGDLMKLYVRRIQERQPYPVRWVGRVGEPSQEDWLEQIPYLGNEEKLLSVVDEKKAEVVVVSYPTESAARYENILSSLANELVTVKVLPDFGRYSTFTYLAEHECGIPLLAFNQGPTGGTDRVLKRTLDIVGSLGFLIVFSPLYALIALLVKVTSKGPVFYSQIRMGADGRIFACHKFRSMRVDAESETGAVWATQGDNRTTPLGKWLRRSSLDELPQFYNVLRGEMSLVGPRPERPVFVDQFRKEIPKYMLRHKMKSGITGWAQINGWRGNTSIEERIKFDLYYIGHWSLLFDIKIMVLTLWKGFFNRHAY